GRFCGFGVGFPFGGGDEEFYSILHEQKDYPTWRWDYDVALTEAIGKFGSGRILDVGAGVGGLLRQVESPWQCYAVERSEETRRELEKGGIKLFRSLSFAAETEAQSFQVIT